MAKNDNIAESPADQSAQPSTTTSKIPRPPDVHSVELHHGIELLRAAVSKLEGGGIEPMRLLKALDPFSEIIVQQLCQAYRSRYIGMSLPLSKEAESLADTLIDLHRAIAGTYKAIFGQITDDELLDNAMVESALQAAHGAQYHLMQALLLAYESYRAEPSGIWREIHGIYQHARSSGIENNPVPDANKLTLKKAYKHALLLGLSNPYHFPFRVIHKINRMLPVWVEKVKLSARLPSSANRCVFLVDAMLDIPAVPLLSNSAIPRFGDHLFLETIDLAGDLRRQMRMLVNEAAQDECLNIDRVAKIEGLKTLRLLVKRWASHHIRSSKRTMRHTDCDLAIGTISVTQAIKDHFMRKDIEAPTDIILSEDIEQTGFSQQLARHRNVIHVSSDWQIRDSSAHGFRLTFSSSQESKIQVNELVAVKPREGDQRWLTGLVQWARVGGNRTLEIGVRTLARDARPVSVTSYATWKEAKAVYILALLLPGTDKSSESMIIPRTELFDPGLTVVNYIDDGEWTMKLNRLISAAPSFYWYQIESRIPDTGDSWSGPGHRETLATAKLAESR